MNDMLATLNVTRGATMLDQERPGWHWEVNPALVDIDSVHLCVLGQLHGTFRQGLDLRFPPAEGWWLFAPWRWASARRARRWAVRHGFNGDTQGRVDMSRLTALWRFEIQQRRAADQHETAEGVARLVLAA